MQISSRIIDQSCVFCEFLKELISRLLDFGKPVSIKREFIRSANKIASFFKAKNERAMLPHDALQETIQLRFQRFG